jgi:hypothetical protein
MLATGWRGGKGNMYGIRFGKANRDLYFARSWNNIDIELDGVLHTLQITPGFWNKCPEVRGAAVRDWLQRHSLTKWVRGKPPKITFEQSGGNRFRVTSIER